MSTTANLAMEEVVPLVRATDDSVSTRSSDRTSFDLVVPDPLAASEDAEYEQEIVRLLGELESELPKLAPPQNVNELPGKLAFVTAWISRLADQLSSNDTQGTSVLDALNHAEERILDAGKRMPISNGWKVWVGLGSSKPVTDPSSLIQGIGQSSKVIVELFSAMAVGFHSPELATRWLATVGLFGKELRRQTVWAISIPQ
jgi:hypothetical protein